MANILRNLFTNPFGQTIQPVDVKEPLQQQIGDQEHQQSDQDMKIQERQQSASDMDLNVFEHNSERIRQMFDNGKYEKVLEVLEMLLTKRQTRHSKLAYWSERIPEVCKTTDVDELREMLLEDVSEYRFSICKENFDQVLKNLDLSDVQSFYFHFAMKSIRQLLDSGNIVAFQKHYKTVVMHSVRPN